jgi:hypothetical protein
MKRILKVLIAASIMVMILPGNSSAQCDSDEFLDKCASNLGTYNYIKTFIAYASPRKKSNHENIYVFSKGSKYKMIACLSEAEKGKMIISLFDRNHNLIACSYDQNTNKYYSELQYPCSATGVYYIQTSFEGTKSGCGMCILGFSKEE